MWNALTSVGGIDLRDIVDGQALGHRVTLEAALLEPGSSLSVETSRSGDTAHVPHRGVASSRRRAGASEPTAGMLIHYCGCAFVDLFGEVG
jgi:hypothetical protein